MRQPLAKLLSTIAGDVKNQILGADYANQMMMIEYPEATGLEASNYYFQDMRTQIER